MITLFLKKWNKGTPAGFYPAINPLTLQTISAAVGEVNKGELPVGMGTDWRVAEGNRRDLNIVAAISRISAQDSRIAFQGNCLAEANSRRVSLEPRVRCLSQSLH